MNKALLSAFEKYKYKSLGILRVENDDESKGTADYLEILGRTAGVQIAVNPISQLNFYYSADYEDC